MTTIIRADSVGPGIRIDSATPGEDVHVRPGVVVLSTDPLAWDAWGRGGIGLRLAATGQDARVDGTVAGWLHGAWLGDAGTANALRVGPEGQVLADVFAAFLAGSSTTVNRGLMEGGYAGLALFTGPGETATVANHGTIRGGGPHAIDAGGAGDVRLTNLGLVETTHPTPDALAYRGAEGVDRVVNRGAIVGGVDLGDGDDLFDGRGGAVSGRIDGGRGDDRVVLDRGGFWADGGRDLSPSGEGLDRDVLDLRSSGGVVLHQAGGRWDEDGTARSVFSGFELVLGSRTGDDSILGAGRGRAGSADSFHGLGGDDLLVGGGGRDRLHGGAGDDTLEGGSYGDTPELGLHDADTLTGGPGDDRFVFRSLYGDGDTITDWGWAPGDDDTVVIAAAAISTAGTNLAPGTSFAPGALDPSRFVARADNRAQDADDCLIFRTTDRTLWLDADGSGSFGPTLLADLQAGAVVTAADIVLA